MITAEEAPDRANRRLLALAIILSVAVHLLGALFYFRAGDWLAKVHLPVTLPKPQPTEEVVTLSSALRLERKPKPVPAEKPQPQRPTRPNPESLAQTLQPPAIPLPERILHEMAKNAPSAPPNPTPPPSAAPSRAPQTAAPQKIAYRKATQTVRQPTLSSRLSQQQLAQLESEFSRAIARARSEENPLVVPRATPAAPKHYTIQMNGVAGDLRGYQGICDPEKSWSQNGLDYYYVSCNVATMNGSVERQAMPWPVHFPPNRDPFNGSMTAAQVERLNREYGVPGPDPDWRPASNQYISPEMRDYAHRHGVNI